MFMFQAIAVGSAFVAAVTSKRYVRIYSITGIVRMIMCLEGDIVSANALDDSLILAYTHARAPPQDQCLQYLIINVDEK
jgi:chromosome transmission fidelity protein 4